MPTRSAADCAIPSPASRTAQFALPTLRRLTAISKASSSRSYQVSGVHLEFLDQLCKLHAAFGTSKEKYQILEEEQWKTLHWSWLHRVVPALRKLMEGGRRRADDWDILLEALNIGDTTEQLEEKVVVCPGVIAKDEVLREVTWEGFEVAE